MFSYPRHWLAILAIGCMLMMDHLPEWSPELLFASLAGERTVASEWDDLPIMYE
jgi:hypothetical protein